MALPGGNLDYSEISSNESGNRSADESIIFIERMTRELLQMAHRANTPILAYLLEMAYQEAVQINASSEEKLQSQD